MSKQNAFEAFALPWSYTLDMVELENRYRAAQQLVHPDRVPAAHRGAALNVAAQVNEAYQTLKDPVARARAWLDVQGIEVPAAQDPQLLVQVMMWQEELADVLEKGPADSAGLVAYTQEITDLFTDKQAEMDVIGAHDAVSKKKMTQEQRKKAVEIYGYLVYLQKIYDRLPR